MPNNAERLKKAQNYLQAGNPARAEDLCRKCLKDKQLALPVRILLAKSLVAQEKLEPAARFMSAAADLQIENIALQSAAGNMLLQTRNHAAAIPYLQRVLSASPDNPDHWYKMLSAMKETTLDDGHEELLALAAKALELFPDHADLVILLAEIFDLMGNQDAASECYASLMDLQPVCLKAHHGWLKIKHEAADYQAVLNYAQRYDALIIGDAICQRTICAALENTGRFDQALIYLNRALNACEANSDNRWSFLADRGRLYMYLGEFELALADLDRSLKERPNQPSPMQNRCLVHKSLGQIGEAAKDEFGRFELKDRHAKFHLQKPLWRGEDLSDKRLFVWSDMGVGDAFKYATLLREISANHIIFMTQPKTVAFFKEALPQIEVRPLPKRILLHDAPGEREEGFEPIEEDFDYQIPLAALYVNLRPDLASFAGRTHALTLPQAILDEAGNIDCLKQPGLTRVGLAWSSKNKNPLVSRNYLELEDWLPILNLPGFAFYNLQYTATEQDIDAFREIHDVPLFHAPGLDLFDDILGTAAFTSHMDLYISPASTAADIAGAMGIKSFRADLVHLPENLGQDHVPWYVDQRSMDIPWGKSILDYMDEMSTWLLDNKDYRHKNRQEPQFNLGTTSLQF